MMVMLTKTTKMLGVGIAAIAFLLVTVPVFKIGVAYADSDHNDRDHNDHDRDHNDRDHNDHHHHDDDDRDND
jgi:hypothetical protein